MTNDQEFPATDRAGVSPDVVVIGGGLAGLAAAATIAGAGRSVLVHERRSAPGGQARSTAKDGFTFNQGPHALYRGGAAERVLTDLGVEIRGAKPSVKGRLVFDGVAEVAPAGLTSLLRTRALSTRGKVEVGRYLAKLPKIDPAAWRDKSVAEWIEESVRGERPAQMMRALVRLATYANQPDLLSADVAIEQLQSALGPGVLYLHNGWQSLVDQLRVVPGVIIETGHEMAELPDAPAVIVAAGGPDQAAGLLGKSFDVGPAAAASCLDLGLSRRPDIDLVIGGDVPFYFSNHSAVAKLAPTDHFHAAVVQYLADGDEPDAAALKCFAVYAGVRKDDVVTSRRLHRMTTVTAIPTAARGGLAGRPSVSDTGHGNVFIAGDWVGAEGHLADASLASGQAAAVAALKSLERKKAA